MITRTHSESTVVRSVARVLIANLRIQLQYIELDDIYQLYVIVTIMAVTNYSNLPSNQLRSHLS